MFGWNIDPKGWGTSPLTRMCLVVARVFGSFVEVVNRAKISEAPAIGKKKMGESLFFQRHTTF